MRFSLGNTASTVAATATTVKNFIKNNLKIYFDFKSSRAKTLEFVGTGSVNFDGNDNVVTITDHNDFSFGDSSSDQGFSISVWVKMSDTGNFNIINKDDTTYGTGSNTEYYFNTNSSNILRFCLIDESSGGRIGRKTATLASYENIWTHLAATYNGDGTNSGIKIYVNGKQSDTGNESSGSYTAMENLSADLLIGRRGNNYSNGNMCQLGIWGRALSVSEVQNIMHKTYDNLKGTELTHLIAWYPLDNSSGTYDNSHSDSHDGSNSGSTLKDGVYADYSPKKPRGFDNAPEAQADLIGSGSASFTASSNEYINIGDMSTFTTEGTIVAWVKPNGGSTNQAIISKYNATADKREFLLFHLTTEIVRFSVQDQSDDYDSSTEADAGAALTVGKWQHVAGTFKVGTVAKVYIDGVLSGSASSAIANAVDDTDEPVFIGKNINDTTDQYFWDGNIAQVGIFNKELTQEEIQSIKEKSYSELTTSEKEDLVSWWGLDAKYGDTDKAVVPDDNGSLGDELIVDGSGNWVGNFDVSADVSSWTNEDDTKITLSHDSGGLKIDAESDGGNQWAYFTATVEVGETYLFTVDRVGGDSTTGNIRVGRTLGGTHYYNDYVPHPASSPEAFAKVFTAAVNTTCIIALKTNAHSKYVIYNNVSLKKITGNYGTLV